MTVDMRAVQVAAMVGLRVVTPVIGGPFKDRALACHARESSEHISNGGISVEALVRKVAMHRHADTDIDHRKADGEARHLNPSQVVPHEPGSRGNHACYQRKEDDAVLEPLPERRGAAVDHAKRWLFRMSRHRYPRPPE